MRANEIQETLANVFVRGVATEREAMIVRTYLDVRESSEETRALRQHLDTWDSRPLDAP